MGRLGGKRMEEEGIRECVFRYGIRKDGLPNSTGNLSLSPTERRQRMEGVLREWRKVERKERGVCERVK